MPTSATAPTAVGAGRVLVAGVGYQNLRDLSAGLAVLERLQTPEGPRRPERPEAPDRGGRGRPGGRLDERVDVEDLSYGPIDVLFLLQRRAPYAAAVFVTGAARGRPPGSVHRARWDAAPLPTDALQERVAEAVTGVISLDNLLYICGHFGALPADCTVIEIEPADEGWGEGLSPAGARGVEEAAALVRSEVMRVLAGERDA